MFKIVATLFAGVAAIQVTRHDNDETTHPAYTAFAHSQDDVVSENDAVSLKRKEKVKKNNVNGKMSLATLKFEQFQDVDRSGQPITGEVANILAALPNRQLDTNFLSNLM